MNAANLFSKLSSKSADYSMMPFGQSENPVNIALYTAGMYRKAYLAARFVWSKDLSVHTELTHYVTRNTLITAQREQWEVKRCRERIEILCRLAMIEHYSPNIFRTQRSRYRYCNIQERQWYRLWSKRYEVPYQLIASYLDIAWGTIKK